MAREYMCQYGNCDRTDTVITVTDGMERAHFCCREHAGLWILRRAWMYEGKRDKAMHIHLVHALEQDFR
jgi:hypothetical protein